MPLADCAPGVWRHAHDCLTCFETFVTPECDVLILNGDGTALDFKVRFSAMQGTLTVPVCASPLASTWSVEDGSVLVQSYARTVYRAPASCTTAALSREGIAAFMHTDGGLAETLRSVPSAPGCTVPYPH